MQDFVPKIRTVKISFGASSGVFAKVGIRKKFPVIRYVPVCVWVCVKRSHSRVYEGSKRVWSCTQHSKNKVNASQYEEITNKDTSECLRGEEIKSCSNRIPVSGFHSFIVLVNGSRRKCSGLKSLWSLHVSMDEREPASDYWMKSGSSLHTLSNIVWIWVLDSIKENPKGMPIWLAASITPIRGALDWGGQIQNLKEFKVLEKDGTK